MDTLDLHRLVVLDPAVIAGLGTPYNLIAEWWAYIPPAILLTLGEMFLTLRKIDPDGSVRLNHDGHYKSIGHPVTVSHDLWRRSVDACNVAFDEAMTLRLGGEISRLPYGTWIDQGKDITLEGVIARVSARQAEICAHATGPNSG